jgi:hypothetical protein
VLRTPSSVRRAGTVAFWSLSWPHWACLMVVAIQRVQGLAPAHGTTPSCWEAGCAIALRVKRLERKADLSDNHEAALARAKAGMLNNPPGRSLRLFGASCDFSDSITAATGRLGAERAVELDRIQRRQPGLRLLSESLMLSRATLGRGVFLCQKPMR